METISHYQVLRKLGEGGMAEVYLAEDTRLSRKVALKILPTALTADQSRLSRFKQEARAVSSLNHPNIVTIYDIGEEGGVHFIATEYVEGETLRSRLSRSRMAAPDILEMGVQVASALAAAHKERIIHRDIKPENIMLRPDGYAKLLDFGIAKLSERRKESSETAADPTVVQTEPGMVIGTPRYMSPEQVRGLDVDTRSDIFSLGVVIYEAVAGKPPFEGATISDAIVAVLSTEPDPLAPHLKTVPPELQRIVSKALQKDRAARYQFASDLAEDLRRLCQQLENGNTEGEVTRPVGSAVAAEAATVLTVPAGGTQVQPVVTAGLTPSQADIATAIGKQPVTKDAKVAKNRSFAIASVLLIVAAVAVASYFFFLRKPAARHTDAQLLSVQETCLNRWAGRIYLFQTSNGGVGNSADGPAAEAQSWPTAQCLTALLSLPGNDSVRTDEIKKAFKYIDSLRHSDPGSGWTLYGDTSNYTVTEIGSWVTLAETASLNHTPSIWSDAEKDAVVKSILANLEELARRQDADGGFRPIEVNHPGFSRTYSTIMAIWSLAEARRSPSLAGILPSSTYRTNLSNGVRWLLAHYDHGWRPNPNRSNEMQDFAGLTAQTIFVLLRASALDELSFLRTDATFAQAKTDFISRTNLNGRALYSNNNVPDTDQMYPETNFHGEGTTFAWFPWSLAALRLLSRDAALPRVDEARAADAARNLLDSNIDELAQFADSQASYVIAENLLCLAAGMSVGQFGS
ncbi:MAG TPA: protein kinase [Blastocatellia bacterium]|nr:protein kinase [Blastocatellia bacterium]